MLTIFAEQPWMIAIMLGVCVGGLFYGWLQSGNRNVAFAAIVTLALIPCAFLVANSIETDKEKIMKTIYSTVEAVEANDLERAVQAISDPQTRSRALAELPKYEFSSIGVRNFQLKEVQGSYPEEIGVDLDASVVASMSRGGMQNVRVVRRVILTFQKQPDGEWLVTDYTHLSMLGKPDNFTPHRL